MDKQDLIAILHLLDRRLTVAADVLVVGGAAMILHLGARRATQDVDAIILRGDATRLRDSAAAVAIERGLPERWLNDAVKGFADILPQDFKSRLVRIAPDMERLQLYVLGLPDQVAMKIVALRDQDLEDLDLLLPRMSAADRETLVAIMEHVSHVRPDWAQRIRYFLLEQGWAIE